MKNLFFGLSIIFLFIIGFSSCSESSLNENEMLLSENRSSTEDYIEHFDVNVNSISEMTVSVEDVGAIHNELLDYQWNYILENPVIPESQSAASYFGDMYSEFFLSYGLDLDFEIQPMLGTINHDEVFNYDGFVNSIEDQSSGYQELTTSVIGHTDDFANGSLSQNEFFGLLDEIEEQSLDIEDGGEKNALLVSIDVETSSVTYWNENFESYASDVQNFVFANAGKFGGDSDGSQPQARGDVDLKDVAEADIGGAAWGARVGFVAAGGPAGAVAVGLAGGAAASAIDIIWQHFWF